MTNKAEDIPTRSAPGLKRTLARTRHALWPRSDNRRRHLCSHWRSGGTLGHVRPRRLRDRSASDGLHRRLICRARNQGAGRRRRGGICGARISLRSPRDRRRSLRRRDCRHFRRDDQRRCRRLYRSLPTVARRCSHRGRGPRDGCHRGVGESRNPWRSLGS